MLAVAFAILYLVNAPLPTYIAIVLAWYVSSSFNIRIDK